MRGLYAIVDPEVLAARGLEVVPFAEALLEAQPTALQLRDKRPAARGTLELLRQLVPLAARAGVPLFANDRPDLALLAGCDGVHVGQGDLPVELVRWLAVELSLPLQIGLSTHDDAQLERALLQPALSYVAIGPVLASGTKQGHAPVVGLEALAARAARVSAARPGTPVVAIGGVTLETAAAVGRACGCAAVIGALVPGASSARPYDEARDRARALHAAILGGLS